MNAPAPPRQPVNVSRVLVFVSAVVALIVAVLILFDTGSLGTLDAIGWLAVAAVVYLASLLVP